jgi:hypothetical protein
MIEQSVRTIEVTAKERETGMDRTIRVDVALPQDLERMILKYGRDLLEKFVADRIEDTLRTSIRNRIYDGWSDEEIRWAASAFMLHKPVRRSAFPGRAMEKHSNEDLFGELERRAERGDVDLEDTAGLIRKLYGIVDGAAPNTEPDDDGQAPQEHHGNGGQPQCER